MLELKIRGNLIAERSRLASPTRFSLTSPQLLLSHHSLPSTLSPDLVFALAVSNLFNLIPIDDPNFDCSLADSILVPMAVQYRNRAFLAKVLEVTPSLFLNELLIWSIFFLT